MAKNINKTDNRTAKRQLGDLGEGIARQFLEKHQFEIIERNYFRKWGEIDIVARKGSRVHFIEVKSINVTQETLQANLGQAYRPEENMHPWKLQRLGRTIETYLLHPPERLLSRTGKKQGEIDWQLDLITVKINIDTHQARVELFENIVI